MSAGFRPSAAARVLDMTSVADAPSDNCDALPAVTDPWPLLVSKAGYYAWQRRVPSARTIATTTLTAQIRVVHTRSRATYGSPRIHAELRTQPFENSEFLHHGQIRIKSSRTVERIAANSA